MHADALWSEGDCHSARMIQRAGRESAMTAVPMTDVIDDAGTVIGDRDVFAATCDVGESPLRRDFLA
jgi:hypothetical protein